MDPVGIKSSHLYIPASVAALVFGKESRAYLIYRPEQKALLLAPASSQWFHKLHQPSQHMLKARNAQGDKTIALHETLIDHDLDDTDRPLDYVIQEKTGILKISL